MRRREPTFMFADLHTHLPYNGTTSSLGRTFCGRALSFVRSVGRSWFFFPGSLIHALLFSPSCLLARSRGAWRDAWEGWMDGLELRGGVYLDCDISRESNYRYTKTRASGRTGWLADWYSPYCKTNGRLREKCGDFFLLWSSSFVCSRMGDEADTDGIAAGGGRGWRSYIGEVGEGIVGCWVCLGLFLSCAP